MTTFLTFSDEEEAQSVLTGIAYFPAAEEQDAYWKTADIGWACNVLGVVYPPATEEDPSPAPFEGYGVNWSGELPEVCLPYVVELETPVNVFA